MSKAEPNISWPVVVKFVRQLNHDLRNHLNAVELQIALLSEIAPDDETKSEIKRLREMTAELGRDLQKLSNSMKGVQPQTMSYSAKEFVEDLQSRLIQTQPELAPAVEWHNLLGAEAIEIDPQLLQEAFLELFANAAEHGRGNGPLVFESSSGVGAIEFRLYEPKSQFEAATVNWGACPLEKVRPGHYGLGLFRARTVFEAHHGSLRAQFDPAASIFVTTVCLPRLVS